MTTHPCVTVCDIIRSLRARGFIGAGETLQVHAQLDAVIEEAGEVARHLRRSAQGRQSLDMDLLATEAADIIIAATCLLATVAGQDAEHVIAAKLAADDARGWLHSGMSRAEYAARSRRPQEPQL